MALTHFRRSGGSTIVTMPAAVMELAPKDGLTPNAAIEVDYDPKARTIIMRSPRLRYTMVELLAQCDPHAPLTHEDETWLTDGSVGNEAV